ncbi:MAG: TolC family protein [Saprospiraceae bacterium]|nr:TolC family protein [Saprospiraceae bacterium]
MKWIYLGCVQTLLIILTNTLTCQSQAVWTLERCIQHALEKNLQIKSGQISVENAANDASLAAHSRFPTLNLSNNIGWNFGRTIDPTRNEFITETFFNNGISLGSNFIIYNGNRINNTIHQANISKQAAQLDIEQTQRDVMLTVATLYLSALLEAENVKNSEIQLEQTRDQLRQLDKLIEVGNRPENDRFDFESQLALNEQNLVLARNNYNIAILRLKQQLLIEPDVAFTIVNPGDIPVDTDPDLIDFETLFKSAMKTQPSVQAAERRIQIASLGEKISASAYYPTLGGRVSMNTNYSNRGIKFDGYETRLIEQTVTVNGTPVTIGTEQQFPIITDNPYWNQLSDNISYGVGVGLNIPIYNNNQARASVQRAKLGTSTAELNYRQIVENLKITVGQAHADAKAAKARLQAANKNLTAQTTLYENAKKRMDVGAVNAFELLRIKSLVESAQINATNAKYEYLFRLKVLDFYLGKPIRLN